MKKLEDKVALVTGGAMGNGLGIAKVFLKYGARVAILDYSNELDKTVDDLKSEYGSQNIVGFRVDIRDKDAVIRL